MKIAILGPGAIGGLLASLFWKNGHQVTCIDKKENVGALNAGGLKINSKFFGNFTATPRFIEKLDFEPDLLFITVKAPFLEEAATVAEISFLKNSIIIPLLNGLEHLDFLKAKYGEAVVAGTIGCVESFSSKPGYIEHLSDNPPCITLHEKSKIDVIADLLKKTGISVEVLENERQVIWQKLLRLSALSALTAASRKNLGFVRSNPEWRGALENFLREAATIATADGASLKAEEALAQLDKLPFGLRSSLQKDLESEKPSELDALLGVILRKGRIYGISCPTIQSTINLIKKKYNV